MRKSKNSDGVLLSAAGEFLTPQQIVYFFSRLSGKRVLPTNKFYISVLQNIGNSFQLDTSDVGQRRKNPYIEFIVNSVKNEIGNNVIAIL